MEWIFVIDDPVKARKLYKRTGKLISNPLIRFEYWKTQKMCYLVTNHITSKSYGIWLCLPRIKFGWTYFF
ncbi:MAG: hypothetical protein Tsb004_28320 [Allomuricauda sp.]